MATDPFNATKQTQNNTKQPPKNNPTPNISSSHDVDVRTAHKNDIWTCSIKDKAQSIDITILKVYIVGIDETYNVIYKRVDDEEIREKDKWENVINKHLEDIKEKDKWEVSENKDILTAINGETWRYKDGLSSKRVKISTFCIVGTINVKESGIDKVHTIAVSDISLYNWKKQGDKKYNFKKTYKNQKKLKNEKQTEKANSLSGKLFGHKKPISLESKLRTAQEELEKAQEELRIAKESEKENSKKQEKVTAAVKAVEAAQEELEKAQEAEEAAKAAKTSGGKHTRKKPRKKTYDTK